MRTHPRPRQASSGSTYSSFISGYLITGLLAGELVNTGRLQFIHYYVRRILRLLGTIRIVRVDDMAVTAVGTFWHAIPSVGVWNRGANLTV